VLKMIRLTAWTSPIVVPCTASGPSWQRQNADVHERVVAELLAQARPGLDYLAMDKARRSAVLLEELHSRQPLILPFARYFEELFLSLRFWLR